MFGANDELLITLAAAIIAAISFAAFALPFLNRSEKKSAIVLSLRSAVKPFLKPREMVV